MKRSQLVIPEPCSADWEAMHGDDRKRFCDMCTKHVHNVSELTEEQAHELLGSSDDLCIQYAFDRSGEVMFADTTAPHWRLHRQVQGAKRLLAAAAIALPLFACEPTNQPVEPTATSPIVLDGDNAAIDSNKPGAGVRPEFTGHQNTPEPEVEIEQGEPAEYVVGKVAIDPEPEEEILMLKGDVAEVHDVEPHAEGASEDAPGCDGEKLEEKTGEVASPSPKEDVRHVRGRRAPKKHRHE